MKLHSLLENGDTFKITSSYTKSKWANLCPFRAVCCCHKIWSIPYYVSSVLTGHHISSLKAESKGCNSNDFELCLHWLWLFKPLHLRCFSDYVSDNGDCIFLSLTFPLCTLPHIILWVSAIYVILKDIRRDVIVSFMAASFTANEIFLNSHIVGSIIVNFHDDRHIHHINICTTVLSNRAKHTHTHYFSTQKNPIISGYSSFYME